MSPYLIPSQVYWSSNVIRRQATKGNDACKQTMEGRQQRRQTKQQASGKTKSKKASDWKEKRESESKCDKSGQHSV